jgi:competence protein CoiA
MPLRAQLDGRTINAALLSDAEWRALKGERLLRMSCCEALAYRRTSRLGTRHFAHSPGHHCGAEGECAEHLAAKAEIVRVCHKLGWTANSEVTEGRWRADVIASRDRHRLAFEIQWSSQTVEVTRERHAAYGTYVKCCWLFRRLPLPKTRRSHPHGLQSTAAMRDLPMFQLTPTDSGFDVTVDHNTVSLREFVQARLERRIHFCGQRHYSATELQLVAPEVPCWRCQRPYNVFYTRQVMRSDCGAEQITEDPANSARPMTETHTVQGETRIWQEGTSRPS